ncbi:hypothetical protein HOF92_08045 [bacterium]|nr:hypothetical protein [bacterium]
MLEGLINAPNPRRRRLACIAIQTLELESARLLLEILLEDPEQEIKAFAERILKGFDPKSKDDPQQLHLPRKSTINEVSEKIQSAPDSSSLSNLLRELRDAEGKDGEKLKIFMSFIAHPDDRVRANAVEYMAPFVPKGHHSFFLPFLEDADHRTRGNAIVALGHDTEVYRSYQEQVSKSLKSLAKSSRSVDQLTALYCVGILCDERYLDLSLSLLESSNPAVSLKAREVLDSWGKVSKEVYRSTRAHLDRFEKYLESESYQKPSPATAKKMDSEPSSESPPSDTKLWDRLRSTMEFEGRDEKTKLLREMRTRGRDLLLAGILQEFLSMEKDPEVLAHLIDTIYSLGPEDYWVSFHTFLNHADSRVVFSAVCALVESDSFRMIPVLAQRMREMDVDEGKNSEILLVTMVQMILLREPLAVQAMKTLGAGGQNAMLQFSICLKFWVRPPTILIREVGDVMARANQENTLKLCLEFLQKHTHPENFIGKVEQCLKKTKSETARKVLSEYSK